MGMSVEGISVGNVHRWGYERLLSTGIVQRHWIRAEGASFLNSEEPKSPGGTKYIVIQLSVPDAKHGN